MKATIASVCCATGWTCMGANHSANPTSGPNTEPTIMRGEICSANSSCGCTATPILAFVTSTFAIRDLRFALAVGRLIANIQRHLRVNGRGYYQIVDIEIKPSGFIFPPRAAKGQGRNTGGIENVVVAPHADDLVGRP